MLWPLRQDYTADPQVRKIEHSSFCRLQPLFKIHFTSVSFFFEMYFLYKVFLLFFSSCCLVGASSPSEVSLSGSDSSSSISNDSKGAEATFQKPADIVVPVSSPVDQTGGLQLPPVSQASPPSTLESKQTVHNNLKKFFRRALYLISLVDPLYVKFYKPLAEYKNSQSIEKDHKIVTDCLAILHEIDESKRNEMVDALVERLALDVELAASSSPSIDSKGNNMSLEKFGILRAWNHLMNYFWKLSGTDHSNPDNRLNVLLPSWELYSTDSWENFAGKVQEGSVNVQFSTIVVISKRGLKGVPRLIKFDEKDSLKALATQFADILPWGNGKLQAVIYTALPITVLMHAMQVLKVLAECTPFPKLPEASEVDGKYHEDLKVCQAIQKSLQNIQPYHYFPVANIGVVCYLLQKLEDQKRLHKPQSIASIWELMIEPFTNIFRLAPYNLYNPPFRPLPSFKLMSLSKVLDSKNDSDRRFPFLVVLQRAADKKVEEVEYPHPFTDESSKHTCIKQVYINGGSQRIDIYKDQRMFDVLSLPDLTPNQRIAIEELFAKVLAILRLATPLHLSRSGNGRQTGNTYDCNTCNRLLDFLGGNFSTFRGSFFEAESYLMRRFSDRFEKTLDEKERKDFDLLSAYKFVLTFIKRQFKDGPDLLAPNDEIYVTESTGDAFKQECRNLDSAKSPIFIVFKKITGESKQDSLPESFAIGDAESEIRVKLGETVAGSYIATVYALPTAHASVLLNDFRESLWQMKAFRDIKLPDNLKGPNEEADFCENFLTFINGSDGLVQHPLNFFIVKKWLESEGKEAVKAMSFEKAWSIVMNTFWQVLKGGVPQSLFDRLRDPFYPLPCPDVFPAKLDPEGSTISKEQDMDKHWSYVILAAPPRTQPQIELPYAEGKEHNLQNIYNIDINSRKGRVLTYENQYFLNLGNRDEDAKQLFVSKVEGKHQTSEIDESKNPENESKVLEFGNPGILDKSQEESDEETKNQDKVDSFENNENPLGPQKQVHSISESGTEFPESIKDTKKELETDNKSQPDAKVPVIDLETTKTEETKLEPSNPAEEKAKEKKIDVKVPTIDLDNTNNLGTGITEETKLEPSNPAEEKAKEKKESADDLTNLEISKHQKDGEVKGKADKKILQPKKQDKPSNQQPAISKPETKTNPSTNERITVDKKDGKKPEQNADDIKSSKKVSKNRNSRKPSPDKKDLKEHESTPDPSKPAGETKNGKAKIENQPNLDKKPEKSKYKQWIVVFAGLLIIAVIITCIIWYIFKVKKRKQSNETRDDDKLF